MKKTLREMVRHQEPWCIIYQCTANVTQNKLYDLRAKIMYQRDIGTVTSLPYGNMADPLVEPDTFQQWSPESPPQNSGLY